MSSVSEATTFSKSIGPRLREGKRLPAIIQEEVDKGAVKEKGFEGTTFLTFADASRAMVDPMVGSCHHSPAGLSDEDFLKWKVSVCSGV